MSRIWLNPMKNDKLIILPPSNAEPPLQHVDAWRSARWKQPPARLRKEFTIYSPMGLNHHHYGEYMVIMVNIWWLWWIYGYYGEYMVITVNIWLLWWIYGYYGEYMVIMVNIWLLWWIYGYYGEYMVTMVNIWLIWWIYDGEHHY